MRHQNEQHSREEVPIEDLLQRFTEQDQLLLQNCHNLLKLSMNSSCTFIKHQITTIRKYCKENIKIDIKVT